MNFRKLFHARQEKVVGMIFSGPGAGFVGTPGVETRVPADYRAGGREFFRNNEGIPNRRCRVLHAGFKCNPDSEFSLSGGRRWSTARAQGLYQIRSCQTGIREGFFGALPGPLGART